MLVIQDAWGSSDLPRGGIGTIGNFDGVHRGHREILGQVTRRGRATGLPAVVVTFEPHPLAVLKPEAAPRRLTTLAQKERLLAEAGISSLLIVRFTPAFARTEAREFVVDLLHHRLGVQEIYVGRGFVFGRDRRGDLALLETLGGELGFRVGGVGEVSYRGAPISSSRIRESVASGAVDAAAAMLGRPYAVAGEITRGDRMGQRIGWPTINLAPENELLPEDGVYACEVFFPSFPATFECVTNIGTRPTVYENYQRVVESHILDFDADVYGERVELLFHRRLREEKIFPTVMDLSTQIGRDVETTRDYFSRRRRWRERAGAEERQGGAGDEDDLDRPTGEDRSR